MSGPQFRNSYCTRIAQFQFAAAGCADPRSKNAGIGDARHEAGEVFNFGKFLDRYDIAALVLTEELRDRVAAFQLVDSRANSGSHGHFRQSNS